MSSTENACSYGDIALAKLLVKSKADPTYVAGEESSSLICALTQGYLDVSTFLLSGPGVFVNNEDNNKVQPLYMPEEWTSIAKMSGVVSRDASYILSTHDVCWTRSSRISTDSLFMANGIGLKPFSLFARSNARTMGMLQFWTATKSGVVPVLMFPLFGSAPYLTKRFAIFTFFSWAAIKSTTLSLELKFGFVFPSSKNLIASHFPSCTGDQYSFKTQSRRKQSQFSRDNAVTNGRRIRRRRNSA